MLNPKFVAESKQTPNCTFGNKSQYQQKHLDVPFWSLEKRASQNLCLSLNIWISKAQSPNRKIVAQTKICSLEVKHTRRSVRQLLTFIYHNKIKFDQASSTSCISSVSETVPNLRIREKHSDIELDNILLREYIKTYYRYLITKKTYKAI